ncbi:hypothetical protein EDC04DRAFT_2610774 [Pisolithus marmoratus]|nr:hypothetical protein EDC04DRAFT_2610774 [Pisolithus marmoratus]
MASPAPCSTVARGNPPVFQFNQASALPKPRVPVVQLLPPTASTSQAKHTGGKCIQDLSGGSEAVQWEWLPHLTDKLLSWLLDNPADHAILFNEKKDQTGQGDTMKPHAQRKRDIHRVIAHIIFANDIKYGEKYATNPGKFTTAVSGCLTSLKSKCQQQASRFKSTEKVIAEFPFWEKCHLVWHGNPSYDARLFDATPGTNQTGDFLAIIRSGGSMVTPADAGQQYGLNEQDDTLVPEEDPREEEEEEEEEFEHVGAIDMSGGHEDQPTGHNVVNEQLGFGNEREVDHRYQSSKSTDTILTNKPPCGIQDVTISQEPIFNHFHIQYLLCSNYW